MKELIDKVIDFKRRISAKAPLVHNITNYVVMNLTANVTLALGASPVMAHAEEEVEEMTGLASALVINIGTLSQHWIKAMYLACEVARRRNIPVVFDPVGAGATKLRTDVSRYILDYHSPTVLRGNSSEILAIVKEGSSTKGVDSIHTLTDVKTEAVDLAKKKEIIIAITGPEDFISDGQTSVLVKNGHPLLAKITGSGCSSTSVIGTFLAVARDKSEYLWATAAGLAYYGLAAEYAAREHNAPGSFGFSLIDWLFSLDEQQIGEGIRIEKA